MFGEKFVGISSHPVGRFRTDLESQLRREIEALLYPELSRLGYELTAPLGAVARGRRAVAVLKWSMHTLRQTLAGRGSVAEGAE